MLKSISLLFLFLQASFVYSQEINKLFYSEYKDRCGSIIQIDDSIFIVSRIETEINATNNYSSTGSLMIVNTNKDDKVTKQYNLSNNEFIIYLAKDKVNNHIIALGGSYENMQKITVVYRFDYNLNLLSRSSFNLDYYDLFNFTINDDDNIVVVAVKETPFSSKSFIFECSPENGILNYQSLEPLNLYIPATFFLMNSKYYIYSYNFSWLVLDENFVHDTTFYALKPYKPILKAFVLNDKAYVGALHSSLNEVVYSIDTNNIQDTFFNKDFSDYATSSYAGFYSLDGNNEGYIFFSNTIGAANPSINTYVAKNYISIHKIDTLGNTIWEYFVGGDSASYLSQHVVATNDGGCIVVFDRFDFDNPFGNEDVYYIKFDADGNVQENFLGNIYNYTGIKKTPKIQAFLIFPNPVKSILNIRSSNVKNKQILIYNTVGKKVLSSNLKNEIDVSSFSKGNYFYEIINIDGEVLQKGKILKD